MTGALDQILQRPKTVLTMMIVMLVAGVMTYLSIPKEANPDIDVPVYLVSISQQGISPKDSERLLVRPMETQLRGLDGLKEITATASQSAATIVLEFHIGSDKDKVLADIRDKVGQAKAELPAEADEPAIFETNFALQPTIIITLSGNIPERAMFQRARQLKDEIESISTVREANLTGNRQELLEVELDLLKMESYDLTQGELINALQTNNQLVAAGFIDDGQSRFNVKVPGLVESADDVFRIPVKQNGEGVVTLGDVASIKRTFKDASSFTRVNGEPAMSIEVVKRIGTNIVSNNKEVRRVVADFTNDWPQSIKVNYMIDQSGFIFEVLGSLQSSILTAIALVMIMVMGTLGVRSGLLVGLAIPTSFMVGFLILSALGMTVNMMVMFGLVLTVGMLVDGAIVITEYADRKMAEGMHYSEAYRRSAKLMFWPVVSSTATTLAAFLPLLFWPGVPGEFMSYLPIMVIIVLAASLLTALVFLPTSGQVLGLVSQWMSAKVDILTALAFGGMAGWIAWSTKFGNSDLEATGTMMIGPAAAVIGIMVGLFGFWFSRAITKWRARRQPAVSEATKMLASETKLDINNIPGMLGSYMRFLRMFTSNIFGNLIVIAVALTITIGTFSLFGSNSKGVEFFVDEEPDVAILFVTARGNLAAEQIRDIAGIVEAKVMDVPGIDNIVMTAKASGGGASGGGINVSAPQDTPPDVVATMQIELADYSLRRKAALIFQDIRQRTANIPGIGIEIRKIEGGPPTGKDIRLEVKSTDYDQMVLAVAKIRKFFDGIKDIQDIEDGRPLPGIEWELTVDREDAGRYNAGITSVGAMIQLVTNGVLLGKYRPDDSEDELDIRVRLPKEQRSFNQLQQLRLRTPNGQVPISNFVSMKPVPKVSSITRRDGQYAMDIKAGLAPNAKFGDRDLTPDDKVAEIQTWLDGQEWPNNIYLKFRGADEEQKETGAFLGKAAIGALFLMFIILLTQFNSFYQTILTLMTVILAVVGVLIGMMVTGQKFSMIMTGTGIVALAGIVVNNAIVLIDTYNRLRSEGTGIHDAILKTSAQRLRPIMLTTITTILGLIPMALTINVNFIDRVISYGGITAIWWIQLSTAVISGLAFSTLLTLILIPVMLSVPANLVNSGKFAARIGGRISGRSAPPKPAAAPIAMDKPIDEEDTLPNMAKVNVAMEIPEPANEVKPQKPKRTRKSTPAVKKPVKRKTPAKPKKPDFPQAAE